MQEYKFTYWQKQRKKKNCLGKEKEKNIKRLVGNVYQTFSLNVKKVYI